MVVIASREKSEERKAATLSCAPCGVSLDVPPAGRYSSSADRAMNHQTSALEHTSTFQTLFAGRFQAHSRYLYLQNSVIFLRGYYLYTGHFLFLFLLSYLVDQISRCQDLEILAPRPLDGRSECWAWGRSLCKERWHANHRALCTAVRVAVSASLHQFLSLKNIEFVGSRRSFSRVINEGYFWQASTPKWHGRANAIWVHGAWFG